MPQPSTMGTVSGTGAKPERRSGAMKATSVSGCVVTRGNRGVTTMIMVFTAVT